jgi:hypothetical protein
VIRKDATAARDATEILPTITSGVPSLAVAFYACVDASMRLVQR